jgi:hypothetical protein
MYHSDRDRLSVVERKSAGAAATDSWYDRASQALDRADRIDDIKAIRNESAGIRKYAERARDCGNRTWISDSTSSLQTREKPECFARSSGQCSLF